MKLVLLLALLPFAIADCPIGTTYHPEFNRCYLFVAEPQPFGLAESACVLNKGHLVSVMNGFENAMLAESAVTQNIKSPYFVGMNKLQGNWNNSDGSSYKYTNWIPGQPTTSATCAVANAPDGGWTSVSCSNPSPFICAIPEDAHPAYTCPTCATPTCPSPRRYRMSESASTLRFEPFDSTASYGGARPYYCESEWTYFEHTQSCYRRFFDATFDDAEEICVSEGGHLTSIWSSAENDFVVDMAKTGMEASYGHDLTLIGLSQVNYPKDKNWYWTDGRYATYQNWDKGKKPDDGGGKYRCAVISSDYLEKNEDDYKQWNPFTCSVTVRSFVCKKGALQ